MAKSDLKQVIGTIAGDDTVLVIAKMSNGGAAAKKELTNFFDKSFSCTRKMGKK
ncbi:MAG: hypothetical protein ACKN8W_02780 [Actinomycetales bacterium]